MTCCSVCSACTVAGKWIGGLKNTPCEQGGRCSSFLCVYVWLCVFIRPAWCSYFALCVYVVGQCFRVDEIPLCVLVLISAGVRFVLRVYKDYFCCFFSPSLSHTFSHSLFIFLTVCFALFCFLCLFRSLPLCFLFSLFWFHPASLSVSFAHHPFLSVPHLSLPSSSLIHSSSASPLPHHSPHPPPQTHTYAPSLISNVKQILLHQTKDIASISQIEGGGNSRGGCGYHKLKGVGGGGGGGGGGDFRGGCE